MSLVKIEDLKVAYEFPEWRLVAVNSVALDVAKKEFLAVVGESGCGKSTLALSLIGLLPNPPAKVLKGSIVYKGTDLVKLKPKDLRNYRGTEIAMIFQEPLTSLNPVQRVGTQIAEAILIREKRKAGHAPPETEVMQKVYRTDAPSAGKNLGGKKKLATELRKESIEALKLVRVADPEQVLERYPFELSGGMRQRVMIAMALAQEPAVLVADEPTTALDVTTQAQVLKLMKELIDEVDTSIVLITHDLAVASQVADRVVVMYAGEVVEDSGVFDLFSKPLHPYTKGLLSCIPTGSKDDTNLMPIPGAVPDLVNPPVGCRYADRCPFVMDVCRSTAPKLIEVSPKHKVSCFLYGN